MFEKKFTFEKTLEEKKLDNTEDTPASATEIEAKIANNKEKYELLDPKLNRRPDFNPLDFSQEARSANPEGSINKSLYGHGSNAYALWNAVSKTNGQIVPHNIRDQLGIPTFTGESMGQRLLNQKFVSVVDFINAPKQHRRYDRAEKYLGTTGPLGIVHGYAQLATKVFSITPRNIDDKISKKMKEFRAALEEMQKKRTEFHGDSDKKNLLNQSNKYRYSHLKSELQYLQQLEKSYKLMDDFELKLFDEYAQIPVVMLGERSVTDHDKGNVLSSVYSDVPAEVGVSRLNIRAVATNSEHVDKVEKLLEIAGITDTKIVTFDDLNENQWEDTNELWQ
ncbi:hypothetical protein ISS03_01575 [Patescibacteria group bacterium]|nr:hypothetical protein [Patescibacteria group bacterium]